MALRIAYVTSGMGHTGTAICRRCIAPATAWWQAAGRNRPARITG